MSMRWTSWASRSGARYAADHQGCAAAGDGDDLKRRGICRNQGILSEVITKYRSGKYTLDEIGIPGGIGKSLDDYDNDDAQVRGAKYANQYLHTEFGKGSKPKRIYIRTVTSKYPRQMCSVSSTATGAAEFVVDWN